MTLVSFFALFLKRFKMEFYNKEVNSILVLFLVSFTSVSCVEWDFFVFSQEWPESACIYANSTHHSCVIPPFVTTWTIHGLWPNGYGGREPSYCNDSWHFDENKIKSLEPQMDRFWPNLFSRTKSTSFWKHEWMKHGTCCTDLDATRDEYHYFSTGLTLNKRYNVTQVLADQQIVPGNSYQLSDIEAVLQAEYHKDLNIQCNHARGTLGQWSKLTKRPKITDKHGNQYLGAVELCLDKQFTVISCPRWTQPDLTNSIEGRIVMEMTKPEPNAGQCSRHHSVLYPIINRLDY